jgi:hypothetical protein
VSNERTICIELLDSIIRSVSDIHVAFAVRGHVIGVKKISPRGYFPVSISTSIRPISSLLSPLQDKIPFGIKLLDPVVALIRHIDKVIFGFFFAGAFSFFFFDSWALAYGKVSRIQELSVSFSAATPFAQKPARRAEDLHIMMIPVD